jgi:hypothetical protein
VSEVLEPQLPFVKLYSRRLLNSTLWAEGPEVFKLFVYMLLEADVNGFVDVTSVKALAMKANLPVETCTEALRVLSSPDPDSFTKDHEGRRLVPQDGGGWLVVNAVKYRQIQTRAQLQKAQAQAAWRAKVKEQLKQEALAEVRSDMARAQDRTFGVGGKDWSKPG